VHREQQDRGGDPAAAGGDDRLGEVDPGLGESRAQAGVVAKRAVGLEHAPEGQVERAGNVAARHAGTRLGLGAAEAPCAARIEHLLPGADDIGEDVGLAAHLAGAGPRREPAGSHRARAALERPLLGAPLADPAVEDRHLLDPVHPANEPGARRGLHRAVVVDHQPVAVANPDRGHACGELVRRRQRRRHFAVGVLEALEIEIPRAGDVRILEFLARVAAGIEQVRGCVDHHQARLAEPFRQPRGRDKVVHARVE
jgi:hypothetical protein